MAAAVSQRESLDRLMRICPRQAPVGKRSIAFPTRHRDVPPLPKRDGSPFAALGTALQPKAVVIGKIPQNS